MWVLHSITLSHPAEFKFMELLKTAKQHEINLSKKQKERERERLFLHRKNRSVFLQFGPCIFIHPTTQTVTIYSPHPIPLS
jgi:hypothetical protein